MKKIALTVLLFALTFGVAGAASVNGDFEGNPIVKVLSGGQDLKVEDVPATIYKGRTVVPVYLLRQLGANVAWNAETYSVNVTLPTTDAGSKQVQQQPQPQADPALQERELLKNTYKWLKDTDDAMVLFVLELDKYSAMDMNGVNSATLELDFKKLQDTYNESYQMTVKVQDQVKDNAGIRLIIESELKALEQVRQTKNFVQLKQSITGSDFTSRLPIAMLNVTRSALQNQMNTNDYIHKLQAQEMKLN